MEVDIQWNFFFVEMGGTKYVTFSLLCFGRTLKMNILIVMDDEALVQQAIENTSVFEEAENVIRLDEKDAMVYLVIQSEFFFVSAKNFVKF